MKISIDGGALCAHDDKQFGNYTFSDNLIRALMTYDKKNHYYIYSFCNKRSDLHLKKNFTYKKILPKFLWSKIRVGVEELVEEKDVYLALNQSIPLTTFSKIISFSHGLSFKFYHGFYHDYDRLNDQLTIMMKDSDKIVVSSLRVKEEMIEINSKIKNKVHVIPFGIPLDMEAPTKKIRKEKFFLHVAMDHPIKNIDFIIKAFKRLRKTKSFQDYELYLVGYSKKIHETNIKAIPHVSRKALKDLYRRTAALLTSSFYESFNLPVLEALSQKSQVVGLREAIVPELRPYVRMADDLDEFIELMKKSVNKPFKTHKELSRVFSWKKYVAALMKLYK